jgi:hypothetical protein
VKHVRGDFKVTDKTRNKKKEKNKIDSELASKILRTVPPNEAFYFFTSIGQYSGTYAKSLLSFYNKLKTTDNKSVDFHFQRGDFEKWIRRTIGDIILANQISKIKNTLHGEGLRAKLCQALEARIIELKKSLASEENMIEHI